MKVKRILPCVCSVPVDFIDSTRNGMPRLVVNCGQFYSCYCPKCGRGTELPNCKSAYLALKEWNETQSVCYQIERIKEDQIEVDYDKKYGEI